MISPRSIATVVVALVIWVCLQLAGAGEIVNLILLAAAFAVCGVCLVMIAYEVATVLLSHRGAGLSRGSPTPHRAPATNGSTPGRRAVDLSSMSGTTRSQ